MRSIKCFGSLIRFRSFIYLLLGVLTVITATAVVYIRSQNVHVTLDFGKFEPIHARREISQGDVKTVSVKPLPYNQVICNISITKEMDLMRMKRLPFIKRFKNPCWYEGETLRCLPYMYLVGAAKCGTSDLFKRITLHPDFVAPKKKEPAWLSSTRFWINRSFSYYTSKYFTPISEALSKSASSDLITGDGSVNTLAGAHLWQYLGLNVGHDEPIENNPEYIFHLYNETRIMINVRNPIDRLWSEYLAFSEQNYTSAESFHNIVKNELQVYKDCLRTRSLRGCMYDRPLAMFATMSREERQTLDEKCKPKPVDKVWLRRGVYHVFIKDYLKVFPRKHVLIQRLEDISDNLETALTRTYELLGLKMPSEVQMREILDLDIQNSKKKGKKGDMLESTRRILYEFYKPHNKQLAMLLNDSKYDYGPRG